MAETPHTLAASIKEKARLRRDETAHILSELVRTPSLSGQEERIVERLGSMLEEAAFDRVYTDGLGNLVGVVGHGDPLLAFDAHIDTVDTGDRSQWDLDPFSGAVSGGYVHGRGSVDQKGGAAALVSAGRMLKELGYAGPLSLYFTFTVMEEDCDGLCWNYLIEQENLKPRYAVITEPTSLAVYRGQRGRMEIELFFSGLSAHGSAPERGDNAVYKASEAALRIRELNGRLKEDDFLGRGSVAVTQIVSDAPSLCAIPDRCKLHLDRRLTGGETRESAIEEIAGTTGGEADITVPRYERKSYRGLSYPQDKFYPTWKLEEDHPLVLAGRETHRLLEGQEPAVGRWTFSTNGVSICGTHGIPVIGYGPGDEALSHAPNERVPVHHLEAAAAFYTLLPWLLLNQVSGG
jgi:putative selenium metabolism hydrolase